MHHICDCLLSLQAPAMKVGDFVGWADTWTDEFGSKPAGIVLEVYFNIEEDDCAQYLILYQHNGKMDWEFGSDLEVMFES